MNVLFAYDGSESSDAALAAVAAIVDPHDVEAVVLCVWEPLTLQALRAERFGDWFAVPLDVTELDEQAEKQAELLAEQGARVAREHGYDARRIPVPDQHDAAGPILPTA